MTERGQPLVTARSADVIIRGGGTLYVLAAQTARARAWVREHVSSEGYNPGWPDTVYVEHRFVEDIWAGMLDDGLKVYRA